MPGHRKELATSLPSSFGLPLLALAAAAGIGVCAGEAKAVLYPVYSRAALGGTEFIDWNAQLGAVGSQPANPFSITTSIGTSVDGSMVAGGPFLRLNETSDASPWQGNFADGDYLLVTDTNDDIFNPITLATPTKAFAGVGTNIQPSANGAFVARVSVYDQANALLGAFDFNGVANTVPGEAIFIGVRSSSPSTSIYKADFSIVSASNTISNYAINQVDYTTAFEDPANTVPAPLPLLGVGAGFAFSRKLRARIKVSKLS